MNAKPCLKRPSILLGCLVGTLVSWCSTAQSQFPVTSGQVMRSLHQFDSTSQASQWQIVNDGVMGGRSTSGATITQAGTLQFSGNISLANNGGFASVRSRPTGAFLGLNSGDTIVMRVKGDGRKYTFNLYTPDRRTAFSYQMDFQTSSGQWQEIRLPINNFVAHSLSLIHI